MASLITTAITGYVKETTDILLKPFFIGQSPMMTQGVKVRGNITGTEKLNYFGRASKFLKAYSQGFNPATGTTYTQRDITVTQMKGEMAQDANEFYGSVLEILQGKGTEWNDLTKAQKLERAVLSVFVEGLASDIYRQFWLNDTNKETLDGSGNYSGTADADYNAYKGIWQHIQENASLTPNLSTGGIQLVDINNSAVAQVSTTTVTGTSGTANITIGGVAYLATFDTDLTTTAANFVTTHATALALRGITATSATTVITFTSSIAGQPFAEPITANVSGDLAGTDATSTANTAPSDLSANDTLGTLDSMYKQAPQVLRHVKKGDKVILMDFESYNNYEDSLRNLNSTESGRTQLINGVEVLTYKGIPVLNLEWGEFIGADFPHASGENSARNNRIIYTTVDNLIMAIDAKSEFNKLESWYNKDVQENRFRAQLKVGANYTHNEFMCVAYEA